MKPNRNVTQNSPRPRSLPLAATPQPPPFRLLGLHVAVAMLWLVLGSGGLVVVAPELARGNFLAPSVLAVVHMFTLGVIATSIFGVLYQFYPMSLGAGARSIRVAFVGAWTLIGGTLALIVGFWRWIPTLLVIGWLALFAAVGCVSWNLLPHRRRMTQGRQVAGYVSAGHSALGFAMLLGAARIGESLGWWPVDRLGIIAAHFHLAAFGFAGLTAVGVGSRMLPMFLVARGSPDWITRAIGPVAAAGLTLLAIGLTFRLAPAVWPGAVLLTVAGCLYVALGADYFRRRTAQPFEPAFGYVAVAFGFLALSIVTGLALLLRPGFSAGGWTIYAELALLGWLILLIVGIFFRILPFLLWLHLSEGRVQAAPETLVHPVWAWASLVAMGGGVIVLVIGTVMGTAGVARGGAMTFAVGSLAVVLQYVQIVVRCRRPARSTSRQPPPQ